MLSPTRASLNASQKDELLRTDKSLRLRFGEDKPANIDVSPSKLASDAKKHNTITFAPFRVSNGNFPGPRDVVNQGHKSYSDAFFKSAESNGGFVSRMTMRGADSRNKSYIQELFKKKDSYNGSRVRDDSKGMNIERQYREERGYPQDYRSPQLRHHPYADRRQSYDSPQESHSTHRPGSPPPSPESPVVTELEKRYGNLRLALHSKVMDGLEKVEKELTDQVTASISTIFDPVAQLDQQYRQVLFPISDGETQLSIVSTQDNGKDSQRSQTVRISTLATDFERETAQVEIELIGKELLPKPLDREGPASSNEARRGKGTIGMKSKLDGLLDELNEDLECMSSEVVDEMSKYEKKFGEKVNQETGKIMSSFFAGRL
ncbi:hypothetical protein PG990_006544 [Apiospora arundinis]|uniref:Uncharacterized protein n=1 Tax=Apiospora arundinis TaxID=335852 RepID=A0ABR2JC04_9PEZI